MPPFQPNQAFPAFAGNTLPYSSTTLKAQPKMPSLYDNAVKGMVAPQQQAGATLGGISNIKRAEQDNNAQRLSSAGQKSGVKFKHDNNGHATGQAAFDTLDAYMKSAGLNSFQANFFGRLIQAGYNEPLIIATVKTAGDRFGGEVAAELNDGLEKLANPLALAARALPAAGRFIGGLFSRAAPAAVKQIARKPGVATEAAKRAIGQGVKQTGQKILEKAPSAVQQVARKPGVAAEAAKRTIATATQPARQAVSSAASAAAPHAARAGAGGMAGAFVPGGGQVNEDGSLNWGNIGRNALIGATVTSAPGLAAKAVRSPGAANALTNLGTRATSAASGATSGKFLGEAGEMLGVLPEGAGDAGYFAGGLAGGVAPKANVGKMLDKVNPVTQTINAAGRAAMKRPGAALAVGGAGLGGTMVGGSMMADQVADAQIEAEYSNNVLEKVRQGMSPQEAEQAAILEYQQQFGGGGAEQPAQAPAAPSQASAAPAQAPAQAPAAPAQDQGNQPQSQQDILQQLLPYLLIGGLGAAGGSQLGGGGAALGGIGLPMLYALATRGQEGNIIDSLVGKDTNLTDALGGLLGGFGGGQQAPDSSETAAQEAATPEAAAAQPAAAQPAAAQGIPGDTDGDGQISAAEGSAMAKSPELLGQMVNDERALDIARQQMASNPEFADAVRQIKGGMGGMLTRSFVPGEVAKKTGLSPEDSQKLIDLAMQL